eukprot:scaffold125666_cov31-Attheya_sp.AAC.2
MNNSIVAACESGQLQERKITMRRPAGGFRLSGRVDRLSRQIHDFASRETLRGILGAFILSSFIHSMPRAITAKKRSQIERRDNK